MNVSIDKNARRHEHFTESHVRVREQAPTALASVCASCSARGGTAAGAALDVAVTSSPVWGHPILKNKKKIEWDPKETINTVK